MIELKNNKKIVVTHGELRIEPLGSILVTDEKWAELYRQKEVRQSVAIGYLTAKKKEQNENKTNSFKEPNKQKKGK